MEALLSSEMLEIRGGTGDGDDPKDSCTCSMLALQSISLPPVCQTTAQK